VASSSDSSPVRGGTSERSSSSTTTKLLRMLRISQRPCMSSGQGRSGGGPIGVYDDDPLSPAQIAGFDELEMLLRGMADRSAGAWIAVTCPKCGVEGSSADVVGSRRGTLAHDLPDDCGCDRRAHEEL
jgi:hypothetical protein